MQQFATAKLPDAALPALEMTPRSYYRARYYDPQTGGFLSEDPLQMVFSESEYQYASANPISRNDPLGLWPELCQLPGYFWRTYDWLSGTYTAGEMTSDFITGQGQYPRDFGPDSVQVQSLKNSVGVNKARNWYRTHGCDSSGNPLPRTGGHKFGLKGLMDSGLDPTLQFVGSYDWKISPNADGTLTFTVTNDTSLTSLLYQVGMPSHNRSAFGSFGRIRQMYHWTESGLGCGCGKK